MILPAWLKIRQISACLEGGCSFCFISDFFGGILLREVLPSNTRCASYCQNCYPSPSGWPGSNPRARSSFPLSAKRCIADFGSLIQITLVELYSCNVFVGKGRGALQRRGKQTCRRRFLSLQQQPYLDWPAATAAATLSARLLVAPLVALPARYIKTVSASLEPQSAQLPALSQTTSEQASIRTPRIRLKGAVPGFSGTAPVFSAPRNQGHRRGQCSRKS